MIAEVALSLMLLAGSSVLLRAFVAMQRVELGVPADRVLTMRVPLPAQRYPDAPRRIAFFQELLRRVNAVPGVAAAAVNSGLHPMGNMWTAAEIAGEAPSSDPVQVHNVSADYTNVVGVQLNEKLKLASGLMFTGKVGPVANVMSVLPEVRVILLMSRLSAAVFDTSSSAEPVEPKQTLPISSGFGLMLICGSAAILKKIASLLAIGFPSAAPLPVKTP